MINVITHKEYSFPKLDNRCYRVLCVGDNIVDWAQINSYYTANSELNKIYNDDRFSELRGVYYLANDFDIKEDWIGVCHYRRYFVNEKNEILNFKEVQDFLQSYDIIVPEPLVFKENVLTFECKSSMYKKDFLIVSEIIKKKYPKYFDAFIKVLNGHQFYYANMFIMKTNIFKEYSSWLFDILFEFNDKIDTSTYNNWEHRVFGYFGEILLNVWIFSNKFSVKHVPVINIEYKNSKRNNFKSIFKRVLKKILYFPNGIPYRRR